MLLSEVDAHRDDVAAITTTAASDLTTYGNTILNEAPEKVAGQLRAASTAVISTYGETAAVTGALFYETQRPKPGFTAQLATPSLGETLSSELGWALVPLFTPELFELGPAEALNRLGGVTQKYVANMDRQTVFQAAKKDPTSTGVRWYASANACAFCALMSAQEARTSDPHWHDHCHCVEVPSWDGSPIPDAEYMDEYGRAASGARQYLMDQHYNHPDYPKFRSDRRFLKAHPELSINNKNLTRVMRERYGFDH
ncbi:VG15 protein [Microbacterium terrisoli]|uniref:VG15 protein n=1 Tax=Microbacterium terrisoli TaxID=3242192 RepID=UPI00280520D0|nr:hypothetical protein [Microbacterium protaetiae]